MDRTGKIKLGPKLRMGPFLSVIVTKLVSCSQDAVREVELNKEVELKAQYQ